MLEPLGASAPLPHPDMPEEPRADFVEARGIIDISPRGACALLRLALQRLMQAVGQSGQNLNEDIGRLVRAGLDPGVQEALDALRVIGNNAVHPGELDLRDDRDTANALFETLNFIVEQLITRPKKLQSLYSKIPEAARLQISKRDDASQ